MTAPVEPVAGPDQHVLGHLDLAQRAVGELVTAVAGELRPEHDDHQIVVAVRSTLAPEDGRATPSMARRQIGVRGSGLGRDDDQYQ